MKSNGLNIISRKPDLGAVVLPLVQLMSTEGLSWQNRADISDAIRHCERHWRSMEEEKNHIHQTMAAGQQQQKLADPANRKPKPGDLDYDDSAHTSGADHG